MVQFSLPWRGAGRSVAFLLFLTASVLAAGDPGEVGLVGRPVAAVVLRVANRAGVGRARGGGDRLRGGSHRGGRVGDGSAVRGSRREGGRRKRRRREGEPEKGRGRGVRDRLQPALSR